MWQFLLAVSVVAQTPSFESSVNMVHLTVTAVDAGGTFVDDLTFNDFVVFEEQRPQHIVYFKKQNIPVSVAIVMDTSSSVRLLIPRIASAAGNLVNSLRPNDEVQIAQFTESYNILTDFTTDHSLAIRALENISTGDETSLYTALYTASRLLVHQYPEQDERRRIIVLLSDGEDTASSLSAESVLEEIRRSGVMVYTVHLRRQIATTKQTHQMTLEARRFVERLAYESGGRTLDVFYPYDDTDFHAIYGNIGRELGTQYQIGFVSSIRDVGRQWRTVYVLSRSRANVTFRYRRGYYSR